MKPSSRVGRILDHLAIAPSTGAKLAHLDGIRSIAVLLVVLVHVWYYSGQPLLRLRMPMSGATFALAPFFQSAYVGVDLFFILSGLLLSRPWLLAFNDGRAGPSTRRYAWLRAFRIVPAYYVTLFLMLLFMTPAYIPTAVVYSPVGAELLAAHLTFTHFLFPFSAGSYLVNGSVWTLTIEVIFYALLPVVVRLFVGRRWLLSLPAAALLSLSWMYLCSHSLDPLVNYIAASNAKDGWTVPGAREFLSRQFPAHLTDFAIGMTLQNWLCVGQPRGRVEHAVRRLTNSTPLMSGAFLLGVLSLLYSMYRIAADHGSLFPVYLKGISMAISFGLILLGVEKGIELLRALFSLPLLRFYGIIGYSVFLWHMPVIHIVTTYPALVAMSPSHRMVMVFLIAGSLTTVLALGSYLAIERPFMLWSRGHLPGRMRPVEVGAQALAAP